MEEKYKKEQKELWLKSLVLICDELIFDVKALKDYCIGNLNGVHEVYTDTVESDITRINNYSYKLHELNKLLKE